MTSLENPQANVNIAKNNDPIENVRFRPYTSASLPHTRKRQPELRGYADMIHCNCAGSRFISFSIVGRAIDTAVEFAILTIIDEVTVSTIMHALSNVLVGGEAGGGDDSRVLDSDASLRE